MRRYRVKKLFHKFGLIVPWRGKPALRKGLVADIISGCLVLMIPAWLFYQSVVMVIILLFLLPFYLKGRRKAREREERRRLNHGFADALSSFSAALEAGYSAENALKETVRELALLYQEDEPVRRVFSYLQHQLQNNQSIEKAFADIAEKTQDEDILCFSEVFEIAKRSGGDLIRVIKTTERTMAERAEVKREIQTVLTAKRLEANIMNLMPCGILVYFLVCDPVYLQPLYSTLAGRVVMTALLLVYIGCIRMTDKITQIEV